MKVVIERDVQGGYMATFPDLVDCQAQAGSLKTLIQRILEVEAIRPGADEPATSRGVPLVPLLLSGDD